MEILGAEQLVLIITALSMGAVNIIKALKDNNKS